jgi:tol-pal system protein YbgF
LKLTSFIHGLIILATVCWLPACATTGTAQAPAAAATTFAPAPISTSASTAAGGDQQIQEIEARLQRLQDSIVMLEARLLDQQRTIDRLKSSGQDFSDEAGTSPETGTAATTQSPTEIYLAAFGEYAAGQYQKSISGFRRFLQLFPANDYASNARYWLAECYFALGQYELAVIDFDRVAVDYPKSSKAPDAMLKKAAALYQVGEEDRAIETIQLLKERYPKSPAAKKATESFN